MTLPQQSKLLIAFGRLIKPDFVIPNGVEVILYDRGGFMVDYGIIDDIVSKVSSSSPFIERAPLREFKNIPLFNRELTANSNVYQRVFVTGNTMPDMKLVYQDASYFPKTVSGIYTVEKADVFINESETPFVKGKEEQYQELFRTKTRVSELITELAKGPRPQRTLRVYLILSPSF